VGAFYDKGGILFVSWLKADFVLGFEKEAFESCFVRHCKTNKAVITTVYLRGRGENNDETNQVYSSALVNRKKRGSIFTGRIISKMTMI